MPFGLDPPLHAQARLRTVRCSMRFSASGTWMMRLTKMPGVTMWSGSMSPGWTRCSTSATRDLAGGRHHRVEVARGLAVDEVAFGVALPGMHDGQIGDQAGLHHVLLAVELADFLALGDQGADAGLGEEGGDAGAAGAAALGERALGIELDLQLAGQELPGEGLVLADIGRDHLPDLARLQQHAQADIVDAGIVGDHGQALHAAVPDRLDQSFRNAAQAEAAGHDRHVIEKQSFKGTLGVGMDFLHAIILPFSLTSFYFLSRYSEYPGVKTCI